MGYRPFKAEDSTPPLKVSRRIIEGRVARFWGMKPWEFRTLEPEKQAELHALYDLENEIEGYYASETMKKTKQRQNTQPRPQSPTRPTRTH